MRYDSVLLLAHMHHPHTCIQGSYALPKDGSPTLGVLGFVFEEQPRPPPTPKPAPVKPAPQTAPEQAPPVRAHTAAKDPKGGGGSIAQAAGGVEQAGLDMHDRRHSQQQEEEPGGSSPCIVVPSSMQHSTGITG